MALPLCFLFMAFMGHAKEVPALTGPVVDQAGILSPRINNALSAAFKQLQQSGGPQIQFLITDSLEGDALETYTIKVTDQWKLGDAKRDDGVLFFISVQDRAMRLEVGQGLEGKITDAQSGRMIRTITPYFKKGDYESGIVVMAKMLTTQLGGSLDGVPNPPAIKKRQNDKFDFFFILFFIIVMFLSRKMRPGRFHSSGSGYIGRSSSWSSSGTSWSGGGGGFSGGGASGRW
jgi:uncharacterized protein